MNSYFVSIIATCITAQPIFLEGDKWDIEYLWTCEEVSRDTKTIQIKAYAQYPETTTAFTTDLFNRDTSSIEVKSE